MLNDVLIRLRALVRRRTVETELDEELRFHIEHQATVYTTAGLPADEALRRARLEFGGLEQVKEDCRDARGTRWMEDIGRDLRFAGRVLIKDRWFAAASIVALALCIGAATTAFTLVNALTRGLPVDAPDRIVRITAADGTGRPLRLSQREFEAWRSAGDSFAGVAAFSQATMNLRDGRGSPEPISGSYISAEAFRLLGETPMLGRVLLPADDRPGAPPVVVLGARVWRSRYDGDPAVIGRTVHVDEVRATVVGVMRDGFRFPMVVDLWQPLAAMREFSERRDARVVDAFGRLTGAATIAHARSELETIAARVAREDGQPQGTIHVTVSPFVDSSAAYPFFAALMGAVGFLLLVGCINTASLQLARTAQRAREAAIRLSQGATRWRIARQMLIESALLAAIAGASGFALAVLAVRLIARDLAGINFPYWQQWTMDAHVFVFAAVVSLVSAFGLALAPAVHASQIDMNEALRESGRSAGGSLRVRRWTGGLLAAELALTLILLGGAGLMMRSFVALYRADLVLASSEVLMTRLSLPVEKYATAEQWSAFYEQLEARLAAVTAVEAFTMAGSVPFLGAPRRELFIQGRPEAPAGTRPRVSLVTVGTRYFETLGLQLIRGRAFTDLDGRRGRETAIVNGRFAALYFPNEDPIGKRIRLTSTDSAASSQPPWLTIVGISPDVRHQRTLDLNELDPVVHVPHRAVIAPRGWLMVRGAIDLDSIASVMRDEIRVLDSDLPVGEIIPLDRYMTQSRWPNRIFAILFAAFAWVSLTLASAGLYAVTAYAVTRRTQEIGIRMAVGARTGDVIWLFVRRPLLPLAAGVAIGMLGVLALGRLLRTFLVQTSPGDPVTLAAVAALLVIVAVTACFVPARRAAHLDPVAALRYE